jgi:hypothetical protein
LSLTIPASGIPGSPIRLDHAAAVLACSAQSCIDDGSRTPHTCFHTHGVYRAIAGTGPTFHAGIAVFDHRMAVIHDEDRMGTDLKAYTATHAFSFVQK